MSQQAQVKMPVNPVDLHSSDLWVAYQDAIDSGDILADPHQALLVEALVPVYDSLTATPAAEDNQKTSIFGRFLSLVGHEVEPEKAELVRGLYIWGGVGRGKT